MDVIKAIAILAVNLQNALGAAGRRRDASLLMHVHSVLGLDVVLGFFSLTLGLTLTLVLCANPKRARSWTCTLAWTCQYARGV